MTNKQIQEMVTTEQWGMWLRYVKKNNVKNVGGLWPNYDFNEFMKALDVTEACYEGKCQGRCRGEGTKPVVSPDVPKVDGSGSKDELRSYDHVSSGRNSYENELSLSQPSDGLADIGPAQG
jgi:hypothetical protein